VFDALKPNGHFVIGDLFPHGKGDMDALATGAELATTCGPD
jgi:hypothetical protein